MGNSIYTNLYQHERNKEEQRIREAQERLTEEEERKKRERENANFFEKTFYTLLDVGTEAVGGFIQGVEGLFDAAVGVAGGIGGMLGVDTEWAEDIIKYNATQDLWYSWEEDLTNKSALNDAPIVKDVVQSIGQQLPTIGALLVAPFTGGASLSLIPATITATSISAGGQGMEEALNDGANYGQSLLYGTITGGSEYLLEKLTFGKIGLTTIGNALNIGGKTATKTIGKVALEEAIQEGLQEGTMALTNPLVKAATYKGGEALESYKDSEFYLDAGKQALVGSLVGGLTASTGAITKRKLAGGKDNASIEDSLLELNNLDIESNKIWNSDNINSNKLEKLQDSRMAELENISARLKNMSEEDRAKAIDKYNLSGTFDENGNLLSNDNSDVQGTYPSVSANVEAYSPSLKNTKLSLAPTNRALSEESKNAKKVLSMLNPNARMVFTDEMPENANAYYDSNKRIYYFSNGVTLKEIVGHEFTHSLEGTQQYKIFGDFILSEIKQQGNTRFEELIAGKMEQYAEVNNLSFETEADRQKALYVAQTEIIADTMGEMLTNPDSIKRIVNQNKSLAHRFVQWLRDILARYKSNSNSSDYQAYMKLRQIEKLYADAIKHSIGGVSLSDIEAFAELERLAKEEDEQLDKDGDLRYSKKKATYIPYSKIGTENVNYIRNQLSKLYNGIENGIADGIGIEKDTTIYVVDTGKDNGDISFGVRTVLEISDEKLRRTYIKELNNDAVSKGHVSDEISSRLGIEYDNGRGSNRRQKFGEELSTNTTKSKDNKERISREDAYRRGRLNQAQSDGDKRYSLKEGRSKEIFEDVRFALNNSREVRDLVVVHNTTATKLLNSIKLGGLAVPSIAITKTSNNFSNFGEISLIFRKDTINPEDERNEVYNSDIYSKRFPKAFTKFANDAGDRFAERFKESAKILNENSLNIEEYLDYGSIVDVADRLKRKDFVRLQYLLDNGVKFEAVYKDFEVTDVEKKVFDMLIEKFPEAVKNKSLRQFDYLYDYIIPEIIKVKQEHYIAMGKESLAKIVEENTGFSDADSYLNKAEDYQEFKGKKLIDQKATSNKIRELIKGDENEVYNYIYDILNEYNEGDYFRNDKNFFDYYGRPRSFDQLYNKLSLENILDFMKGQVRDSEGDTYGVGNIRSLVAKQYKTLEEIKNDSNKIISSEEMQLYKEISDEVLLTISDEVDMDLESTVDLLKDIAKSDRTKASFISIFREYGITDYSTEMIPNISLFLDSLQNYPTEYFEAKPQRVVEFDEVVKVFAPKGTNQEIITFFNEKKIDVELYDDNTPSRRELVKNLPEDIRFSLKDSEGNLLSNQQVAFFKDSKIRDEQGYLLPVYHGTEGEFYTFDKALRGANTGARDAKLGFFFTNSEMVAKDYAIYAQDGVLHNLMFKIAQGDPEVLRMLRYVDGYKKLEQTDLVKEFGRVFEKSENYENDILKVYLNITNPKEVDWGGKVYKKNAMLKVITEAIAENHDGVIIRNIEDSVNQDLGVSDVYVAFEPNQIKLTTNKAPTLNEDMRYSLNDIKITKNMSDGKRYEILKDKVLTLVETNYDRLELVKGKLSFKDSFFELESASSKRKLLSKIGEEFGVYKDYTNSDMMIEFVYSKNNLRESVNKQRKNFLNFAKMLSCFDGVVENAIGIEVHNRNDLSYKLDNSLKNVYVLASAFIDKDLVIPVKLEIKEFNNKKNTLYVAIALEGIKIDEVVVQEVAKNSVAKQVTRSSIIRLHDLLSKVNKKDENFIKYIPKQFFDGDNRYSIKDGEGDYKYSKGQIAKYVASHSKEKVYSKEDAEKIVDHIVSEQLSFGNKYGELKGKSRAQIVDTLFHALNTADEGYRGKVALDIADYIIKSSVMRDIYYDEISDTNKYIIGELKEYLHNIDLSGIKSEIKYRYDTDNSPYLLWGKRKGTKGVTPDLIGEELSNKGFDIPSDDASEIFFYIDNLYRNAVKDIKDASKKKLLSDMGEKVDLEELRQSIAKEVLLSYNEYGEKTKFAKRIEDYTNKISNLKQSIRDIKAYNKAEKDVISTIELLKKKFVSNKPAGWDVPKEIVTLVNEVSKVETWKGNISKRARECLNGMQKNLHLIMDDDQLEIYPYKETLTKIASGEGDLTTEELWQLNSILKQFKWQLENYNKVTFEGKAQSVDELAARGVKETLQAQTIMKKEDKALNRMANNYYTNPYDRLSAMGLGREDSIAMRVYNDMLNGDRRRVEFRRDANMLFEDFIKNNKNYFRQLQDNITIGEGKYKVSLPKCQALALYTTSLRDTGRNHLFNISDTEGVVKLLDNVFATKGDRARAISNSRDIRITVDMIEEIKNNLSEADKAYLELVDTFFNKLSKEAKKETDEKLYGITNVVEGYYFPTHVSSDKIYTKTGEDNNPKQYILSLGINKPTKPNANNKLVIDGIDNIIQEHIHDMSMYYGFALPLNAYNRITNRQVFDENGVDVSRNMRTELHSIDPKFNEWMDNLWKDLQGISRSKTDFIENSLSYMRWAGASAALGANPKVLTTQTLGLVSSLAEFKAKYIVKGIGHFFSKKHKADLYKYAPLMWERAQFGNSVDVAELQQIGKELGSKIGKLGAKATKAINLFSLKPIAWMDSNVIEALWFAAQYEIADTMGKGYEWGTEANKIEAGKRLEEVVIRTQQTNDALGRSEWMRNNNALVKFVRMFTGDSVQLTGRLINSVRGYKRAKEMVESKDPELVEQGKVVLRKYGKAMRKAASAVVVSQLMLLGIAMLFKTIKGWGDDEEPSEELVNTVKANLVGLLPLGGEIYNVLEGYEPTNMAYTALSNTVNIAITSVNGLSAWIKGEYQEPVQRNANIRKTLISISKLFGVPLQNLESYTKGIVGHISPATREEWEALFKTKSNAKYLEKIQKATANGDEEQADRIINIMFNSLTGKINDDKVLEVTRDLIEQGYDVLPKSINKTITYNDVAYTLSSSQYNAFKETYSKANESIRKMINTARFNRLTDEAKAKAMKYVYNYYYNLGLQDLTGEDLQSKDILFGAGIPIEKLAMAISQAQLYTSDGTVNTRKVKIQALVQSLPLSAVQKYMIMGYLGYSNKYGESQVKSYIQGLKLTNEQKTTLFEKSGY